MSDVCGEKSEKCTEATRTLSMNVLCNYQALKTLHDRFDGIFGVRGDERGIWVLCVDLNDVENLAKRAYVERDLLSGVPYAAKVANKRTPKPFNIDWSNMCSFVPEAEVRALYAKIKQKAESSPDPSEEVDFHVHVREAPLMRLILHGKWDSVDYLLRAYDPSTSLAIAVGVMDFNEMQCFHARTLIARMAPPTDVVDEAGEWREGHLLALLCDHLMQTIELCQGLNERAERCGAPAINARFVDEIISNEMVRIILLNDDLMPVTPISMRKVALAKNVKAPCTVCEERDGALRCSKCHLYRYCGAECQRKHWTQLRGRHRVAHKHVCASARTYMLVLCQMRSDMSDALFKTLTRKSAALVRDMFMSSDDLAARQQQAADAATETPPPYKEEEKEEEQGK